MLIGPWKSFDELESHVSLPELELILEAKRKQERREHEFMAALKGIDLNEGETSSAEDRFEEIKRRADAKLGRTQSVAHDEMDFFGLELEVEE